MLFVLTGDIQTGKTRWLLNLVDDLAAAGVISYGVMAPGIWIPSTNEHADKNGFEKTGIDNLLLPDKTVVHFADRNDLVIDDETIHQKASQAKKAELGWHIYDAAIDEVNIHLANMYKHYDTDGAFKRLLVIDELGILELLKGTGLTEAVHILDEGPNEYVRDALVVVREALLPNLEKAYAKTWGGLYTLSPNEESLDYVLNYFNP